MMSSYYHQLFLPTLFLAFIGFAHAQPASDLWVAVKQNGSTVIVDANEYVSAPSEKVWEVLTDFDHMARFSPSLRTSTVVAHDGNKLRVQQTGQARFGPFSLPFETLRDVLLDPNHEIHSTVVSGTLKSGEATTILKKDGAGTKIIYHSESVPSSWVPAGFGLSHVEAETRAQFESIRNEVLKRQNGDRERK
jgi:carbon monoxide dehydrogenase subunit G